MSESVEQAAPIDWQGRARREAAAILDETGYCYVPGGTRNPSERATRDGLIALLALAWIQGVNFGEHRTLSHAERAFDELRAAL